MIPVGTFGLSCLSPDDPAATALYMQSQGNKIDALLDGISDGFDSFYLRPAAAWVTTTQVSNGGVNVFGPFGFNAVNLYANFPVSLTSFQFVVPRSGMYQFGANVNMVAAGAVTVGSFRRLQCAALQSTSGPPITLGVTNDLSFDTNTTGEWLNVSAGSFMAEAGVTVTIVPQTAHGNAASAVVNQAGGKVWVHWTGSAVEIART